MAGVKCTRILMDEHKTILRALNVLEAMREKESRGLLVPREDVRALLDFFKFFVDDLHQGKEETILFPALTSACDSAKWATIHHLIFEHNQERSLVEGMQDALLTSKGPDFAYYATRFVSLIRNHIYKEDHILFEITAAALPDAQDDTIVEEFNNLDRSLSGVMELGSLLRQLTLLEWNYLGRAAAAGCSRGL